jgi:hypothetical protein
VVPTVVPRRGGEGRAGNTIPECFDVEEERGVGMEAHTERSRAWWRARSGGGRGGGAGADRCVVGK